MPSFALSPARSQQGLPLGEGLFPSSSVISGVFRTYVGLPLEFLHCAFPIWPPLLEDCKLEVSTDASDAGWGIYFQGKLLQGLCCGCPSPSPYQCEGTHGPSRVPGGLPSLVRRTTLSSGGGTVLRLWHTSDAKVAQYLALFFT